MNDYQIFISYRRDGGEFFGKILCDKLTARGYRVFFDVESLKSGAFNSQIYDVIDMCEDFILILSPGALDRCRNEGDWVYNEITYAIGKKKNIVPIIMRGFEFPKEGLPEGLESLVGYQNEELSRISSNDHIDASVNRICRSLLKSIPSGVSKYSLEGQEYYKIKTPIFTPYKDPVSTPLGLLSLMAYIERMYLGSNGAIGWAPPNGFDSLKELFMAVRKPSAVNWYNENVERLDNLHRMSVEMKKYSVDGKRDLYFYYQAVFYSLGVVMALPPEFVKMYPLCVSTALCYCADWPYEYFGDLEKAFGSKGYNDFCKLLPLAFSVWPTLGVGINSEFRKQFDNYAILLFDYMLEFALLINDACRDNQHIQIVRGQILSYYKWLRKKKLYLPKAIQKKVYRYL